MTWQDAALPEEESACGKECFDNQRENPLHQETPAFSRAKYQHVRLKNAHTAKIRAQASRDHKKEVNKQFRKYR